VKGQFYAYGKMFDKVERGRTLTFPKSQRRIKRTSILYDSLLRDLFPLHYSPSTQTYINHAQEL
jgi:hypothetical protein